jgi:heme/copper-type cytochrome/quinol oxidase subunit 1
LIVSRSAYPLAPCATAGVQSARVGRYKAFVASVMAFAALSMSVWAHHMFTTGGVTNQYFAATSTALVVPAGIEYFDMIGTLIGGALVLRCSMRVVAALGASLLGHGALQQHGVHECLREVAA